MPTLTFVTGNQNKKAEVVAILGGVDSDKGSKVGEYYIVNQSLDIEEVQGTIDEVTVHKAKAAAKLAGGPVLVEDTCLAFAAFNDLPGPYIKWFVQGVGLQGLVDMLYKFEDKSAKAICTFGYCEGPDKEVTLFQGITHGKIVDSRGPQNFGWDAIFQPDGYHETYAEMDKKIKNGISHRYKALKQVQDFLLRTGPC
ncbi:Maf/Ham1 [Metschnikowia bicuspidata var. bicuspidata NRRL YB-4993]|uniref:Inosine triphosphate pyrophosphatase n=1 Tax=Metschnikowia bicuspidata var. bicuspidata NRRL YB-4993 TaxID=869754 RepID=A0A1A0HCQ8_9ASCO|nr:Maf/Ham1 [Metschnikowia bicuspidata var. bicuspidata NRRL YB-4993]OBA21677.1 Maf/Ham1 [Metschnikowia bicuspidata var. bicuspidata NRRL YB-4993]